MISGAVPAYIHDSPMAIFARQVYCSAALALIASPVVPDRFKPELQGALERAERQLGASHRAWILRDILDRMMGRASSGRGDARRASSTASEGPTRARSSPDLPSQPLINLPEDMTQRILTRLSGSDLGRACGTCLAWRRAAAEAAEHIMRSKRGFPQLPVGICWPRALAALNELEARIGPRDSKQGGWWHDWPAMRLEEIQTTGVNHVTVTSFAPGGTLSMSRVLRKYGAGLQWMIDRGWSPMHASAALLIPPYGSLALARALREGSREYVASAHEVFDALSSRARLTKGVAPPTYAAAYGPFGLTAADPNWYEMLHDGAQPGVAFHTSAIIQASDHPRSFPDEHGISVPMHRLGSVACNHTGQPIIRFVSAEPSGGCCRSLLQTSPTGYVLPMLATIRLVSIDEADQWRYDGHLMSCRCYTVTVAFIY